MHAKLRRPTALWTDGTALVMAMKYIFKNKMEHSGKKIEQNWMEWCVAERTLDA